MRVDPFAGLVVFDLRLNAILLGPLQLREQIAYIAKIQSPVSFHDLRCKFRINVHHHAAFSTFDCISG